MQQLNKITVPPLTKQQKANIVKTLRKAAVDLHGGQLQQYFIALSKVILNYMNDYNRVWAPFHALEKKGSVIGRELEMGQMKMTARALSSEQKKALEHWYSQAKWLDESITATKVQELIYVLQRGLYILQYIQQQFTGQQIDTIFHVKHEGKIIAVSEENLPMSIILSTYGASGENYVSLAYQLEGDITKLIQELEKTKKATVISGDQYWNVIWEAKEALGWSNKYYDSKDAEIYQLISSNETEFMNFNVNRYRELRDITGAGSGAKTQLQGGDIANKQMKLITSQVNFARQTLIQKNLLLLYNSLQSGNINSIKETMLNMFTSYGSTQIYSDTDQGYNQAAQEAISAIFQNFTG